VPKVAAKAEAWHMVINDPNTSLAMKRAIAGGFHRTDQLELLAGFVEPYFEALMPVWESFEVDQAISIIEWMYPKAVLTRDVIDATDQALAGNLPGPIRRSLLESQDAVKRALRAQAHDRT
jgi:aminopeptidase N